MEMKEAEKNMRERMFLHTPIKNTRYNVQRVGPNIIINFYSSDEESHLISEAEQSYFFTTRCYINFICVSHLCSLVP